MTIRFSTYLRLFSYLKPFIPQLLLAYGGMIIAVIFMLFIPQLIESAIDETVGDASINRLVWLAVYIILLGIGQGLAAYARLYYQEVLTYSVSFQLRNDFYNTVQSLPFSFHTGSHTGDLMSRATADIGETERFVGIGLVDLSRIFLLVTGIVVAMFIENSLLALIALSPILIFLFVAIRFGIIVRGMFKALQEQLAIISQTMQESLTGIQLVKVFAREAHELEKFDADNSEWVNRRVRMIRIWSNNWPTMILLVYVSVILVLWFGGQMVLEQPDEMTVGSLSAMLLYLLMLNGPVQRIGFLVNLAATAGSAAQRVFEIMDTPNELEENEDSVDLAHLRGHVRFENVSFGYHEKQNILSNISFEAKPNQTIALIGPTGSGKSTLTNLIPRFYDATQGTVSIDGHDVRALKTHSLRKEIGIVLQESFLFSDTIAENIAYGRTDSTFEQIVEAAKAAHAHDFIARFPEGYQTMVGERGVTLSGGQKQRVAIARALLADPRILILDDSTSSVDTETEYQIQQALDRLMEGRTTIVIAQRLLTLKNADKIIVLDEGEIVEQGTHYQLLEQNGLYKELYDVQLKDQEELKLA
ncbi:MAG: ABC transporter ATP-binding protein [Chloroflexota bacterium]